MRWGMCCDLGTIHSLTLDGVVSIVFGQEELEVCLRVLDRADLVVVVDEVACKVVSMRFGQREGRKYSP